MIRNATLVLGAVAVALVAAEIAVRVFQAENPATAGSAEPDPELTGMRELTTQSQLKRPGIRGVHYGVVHRANDRGVRGPDYTDAPLPGVFRIAVAGDSVTMGHGVREEDAYPARLESLLEAGSDQDFEVINLGLSGLTGAGAIRRLVRVGLPYEPNLLVYGFNSNDIFGPGYRRATPEARQAFEGTLHRFDDSPSRLLRIVWPRLVLARSGWSPLPGSFEHTLRENYLENPDAWRQIEVVLDRLASIQEERGDCALVFAIPVLHQLRLFHPFEPIYDRVQRASEERGLLVAQALPAFRGRDGGALRLAEGDRHPNAAGHELLATALYEAVIALPERCGVPAAP